MGGGAGEAGSVLSTRQKEILAATWRLIRDQKTFKKGEYSENLKLVASQQQKLQQQTKTLSERIQRRALTTRDPEFQKLSENLEKALEAMTPAPADAVPGKAERRTHTRTDGAELSDAERGLLPQNPGGLW